MNVGVLKRVFTVIVVGGILLWMFYEPTEGNLVNKVLELLSKRVLSTLGGVEP